jgi:hypothetical protein
LKQVNGAAGPLGAWIVAMRQQLGDARLDPLQKLLTVRFETSTSQQIV